MVLVKQLYAQKLLLTILDNKFVGNDRHKLSIVNFAPKSSNHSELINFGRLLNLNVNSISSMKILSILLMPIEVIEN